jgi:uncharacterized protein YjcR
MLPTRADTEAVASQYSVAVGTIYRWASEDNWTRYGTARARLWSLEQAYNSWARRHPDFVRLLAS